MEIYLLRQSGSEARKLLRRLRSKEKALPLRVLGCMLRTLGAHKMQKRAPKVFLRRAEGRRCVRRLTNQASLMESAASTLGGVERLLPAQRMTHRALERC